MGIGNLLTIVGRGTCVIFKLGATTFDSRLKRGMGSLVARGCGQSYSSFGQGLTNANSHPKAAVMTMLLCRWRGRIAGCFVGRRRKRSAHQASHESESK
jgi:hypothetical protein